MAAEPGVTETSAYKVKPWKPTELAQVSRAVTHSSRFPLYLKTGIMSNSNTQEFSLGSQSKKLYSSPSQT